ncbi:MAG: chemotaxis protein [Oscillospiraceae bacterium]
MSEEIKTNILLESGTNEFEIMEFTIDGDAYGINVAKVREIMLAQPVKKMPCSHPCVDGVFKPRDSVITVVNLPKYLKLKQSEDESKDLFIVTNFNKLHIAFRVNAIVGIDRISWKNMKKPDATIYGGTDGVATGIAEFNNHLITIIDFEKIVADISPETSIKISEIEDMGERDKDKSPILIAEDSALLSKMIHDSLHKAGYINTIRCNNGQEAWDWLEEAKKSENIKDKVSLIITDIEMPQMDGHRLTKLVKEDSKLKNIPLIIFSSLINEEMQIKGKQLGADEQLSKPEIGHLVHVIDELLKK